MSAAVGFPLLSLAVALAVPAAPRCLFAPLAMGAAVGQAAAALLAPGLGGVLPVETAWQAWTLHVNAGVAGRLAAVLAAAGLATRFPASSPPGASGVSLSDRFYLAASVLFAASGMFGHVHPAAWCAGFAVASLFAARRAEGSLPRVVQAVGWILLLLLAAVYLRREHLCGSPLLATPLPEGEGVRSAWPALWALLPPAFLFLVLEGEGARRGDVRPLLAAWVGLGVFHAQAAGGVWPGNPGPGDAALVQVVWLLTSAYTFVRLLEVRREGAWFSGLLWLHGTWLSYTLLPGAGGEISRLLAPASAFAGAWMLVFRFQPKAFGASLGAALVFSGLPPFAGGDAWTALVLRHAEMGSLVPLAPLALAFAFGAATLRSGLSPPPRSSEALLLAASGLLAWAAFRPAAALAAALIAAGGLLYRRLRRPIGLRIEGGRR